MLQHLLLFSLYSGISIVMFLVLLLSKSWKKEKSKKILALILVSFLLFFLSYLSLQVQIFKSFFIWPLGIIVNFLLGPLLYFYIQLIYQADLSLERKDYVHFFPFVFALITFWIPTLIGLHTSTTFMDDYFPVLLAIPLIGMLSLAYYIYLSFGLLKRYKSLVKNNYSSLSEVDLRWLMIWIKGIFIFFILDLASGGLIMLSRTYLIMENIIFINLFYLVGLIWYIGYYGINQTNVFLMENINATSTEKEEEKTITKANTSLLNDPKEIEDLKQKLQQAFEVDELYKEETITLREVAKRIDTTDKKLSELINTELQSNFYEYVNGFRVEAFKQRVQKGDAKDLTLLAIAYESGFNSKATFNRIFKQYTGLTPSQYKKEIKRSLDS